MAPAALPQELIVHIIGCCKNDPKTLRNLALVSRNWLLIARDYLFFSITLRGNAQKREPFPSLSFVNTDSPINSHVKNINIITGLANPLDLLEWVLKLPNLRSISMNSLRITPPPSPPTQLVPHLETLLIRCPVTMQTNTPWRPLFDFLSGFVSIGTLHLENVLIRLPGTDCFTAETPPPPTPAPARKTRLDSLGLSPRAPVFKNEFRTQITEFIDLGNIRSLYFDTFNEDRTMLQTVIDGAVNLKELRIDLCDTNSRNLSLGFCRLLEMVDVKIFLSRFLSDEFIGHLQENFRNALAMISSLPLHSHASPLDSSLRGSPLQSSLAHFRLGIYFPNRKNVELSNTVQCVRWSDLENTLRPFTQLQSAKIDFLLPDMNDEETRHLQEQLGADSVSELVKRDLAGLSRHCLVQVSERRPDPFQ